uniref:Ketoreductase domain-containing protein n=1 Tax=Trieres chinensis TaxID=1514140 RepID=A0A7S1Z788_TRICV|mmetsp:Transcript_19259/g.39062  ORF Transcript_19259/g.39062 Transcript_19259/m.39062 type:complete len:305 (+) Transcript_19259:68-982(+)|eukprot:CAMPEP_0183308464 /NCGR_PEP_ID=MMETSP0160_2-20130417/22148_1 /TAXON_ID=2839 ORGANISM="Odontella Sinensis, Strain Grunow 1884" /NCGR_SAMPLE_ID=MMETSP0160_2 /ASSEMBLY_ACC=CAM_ASM_000250 /LENGTH=304 /DNA_ID=CAMNT_0025472307 /DNA_START=67 /DNA_END=981 /DNA_ORIENTATION=+
MARLFRASILALFALLLLPASTSLATMSSKTVLVTGGNKGIGKAVCARLLSDHPDVTVLLGSRDAGRGDEAVRDLESTVPGAGGRVKSIVIDTSSDESVKAAANSCGDGPLYGVVNNAGIWGKSFDDTLDVNYFGVRRVCDAFEPKLVRPGGRIVNIGSASGPMFVAGCRARDLRSKLADPLSIKGGVAELDEIAKSYFGVTDYGGDAYGLSKALLNAYTVLHARDEPDLIVNSCSPGFIRTDLTINAGLGATNPPEKGAFAPVDLLMNSKFEGIPTGRYYGSDAVRSPLDCYRGPGDPPFEGP